MTTRFTMVVALLLVLAAQIWGLVAVWREDPLRSLAATGKKEVKESQAAIPQGESLSLQPTVPSVPPDLNQGFIFNAERSLVPGGGKDGQSQNAGNVGMDKIHYNGSIIIGENTRALLSYASGGGPVPSPGGSSAVPQKQRFLRVTVGDTVDGYKVTEILPGKITFSRGGQQITKLLYDRNKERVQAQPSPPPVREPGGPVPALPPPPSQAPRQDDPQPPASRQLQAPPSNGEPRKTPLQKRPEQPKDPNAPNARDVFKMLIEKQQQRNQALGRGEKNEGQ